MPVRLSPESGRSVHELCAAVITTAERARGAAWDVASGGPTSSAICSTSGTGSRRPARALGQAAISEPGSDPYLRGGPVAVSISGHDFDNGDIEAPDGTPIDDPSTLPQGCPTAGRTDDGPWRSVVGTAR